MTVLIVQSRLGTSRLPRKALLPLGEKTVLRRTLETMRRVPADRYVLATDTASYDELLPEARAAGFECFAGPEEDVLERFCLVAEQTGADIILRATGDNPFLFYEAASALEAEFTARRCDYITWTGLPHGSGVELFSARALLEARHSASAPCDREHVGPALYNYPGRFVSVMLDAPEEWHFPQYRTTVDTCEDYIRAHRLLRLLKDAPYPFSAADIAAACAVISRRILCVPSVRSGGGTGHLRRCISVASSLACDIYVPRDISLPDADRLLESLDDFQILRTFPGENSYDFILCDCFSLDRETAARFASLAPVLALDEGGSAHGYFDYLLDIIPSGKLRRKPNLADPGFIPLPVSRRSKPQHIRTVLVTVGGEDPAGLTFPAAAVFAGLGCDVTAVVPDPSGCTAPPGVVCSGPVENLREKLSYWDLVVTHYGFTAFEAAAAGCAVLLLGTSKLHTALSRSYGFAVVPSSRIRPSVFADILRRREKLFPPLPGGGRQRDLDSFVRGIADGSRARCPVCAENPGAPHPVVFRGADRTVRRCRACGMIYLSWTAAAPKKYTQSYFFEEYRNQYGKTYLEDFQVIKAQGARRAAVIARVLSRRVRRQRSAGGLSVLDVGCAYGPFLAAAYDAGWETYGTDISADAVSHVAGTLRFPAVVSAFPGFDAESAFGRRQFDAVTMWYVIEHFSDLDAALSKTASLVRKGGVFAFSTPSASGVSARFSRTSFFANSPSDHFTLWEPSKVGRILGKYGFSVKRIVSTGHHPERFPFMQNRRGKMLRCLVSAFSRAFRLGDTFEAYLVKD